MMRFKQVLDKHGCKELETPAEFEHIARGYALHTDKMVYVASIGKPEHLLITLPDIPAIDLMPTYEALLAHLGCPADTGAGIP